jgi:putative phosphoribosyl transferase
MMNPLFQDRHDAGRKLAAKLEMYKDRDDVVVLALPRGGMPVAYEVAQALDAPLDVFLVRKLGAPGQEELAMGAIASGGVRVLNEPLVQRLGISQNRLDAVIQREQQELIRREHAYRPDLPPLDLRGKTVILVDDGLATGATMIAAVRGVNAHGAGRVVVAVPTSDPEVCAAFEEFVDTVVCAETPQPFWSVGTWYGDFAQTTDEEVRTLLARAAAQQEAQRETQKEFRKEEAR